MSLQSSKTPPAPEGLAFEALQQITAGYFLSRCLQVVANFGVADMLGESPAPASALARATGTEPAALRRVLSLLSAHGVFQETEAGFVHSPLSRMLRRDHPQSLSSLVQIFGFPAVWDGARDMTTVLKTGHPQESDGGFWKYLADHPDESHTFNEAMAAKASGQVSAVIGAYDFSEFRSLADIGGGRGHLLQAILAASPTTRGVLFDLPHVIRQVSAVASDRLQLVSGSFLHDELPRCDGYVLMEVIHDWNDEMSIRILRKVRSAAPAQAKLLLIEALIPDTPGPSWTKTLDIVMLTLLGGGQRTYAQYEDLLSKSGFRLRRRVNTASNVSILVAEAA